MEGTEEGGPNFDLKGAVTGRTKRNAGSQLPIFHNRDLQIWQGAQVLCQPDKAASWIGCLLEMVSDSFILSRYLLFQPAVGDDQVKLMGYLATRWTQALYWGDLVNLILKKLPSYFIGVKAYISHADVFKGGSLNSFSWQPKTSSLEAPCKKMYTSSFSPPFSTLLHLGGFLCPCLVTKVFTLQRLNDY